MVSSASPRAPLIAGRSGRRYFTAAIAIQNIVYASATPATTNVARRGADGVAGAAPGMPAANAPIALSVKESCPLMMQIANMTAYTPVNSPSAGTGTIAGNASTAIPTTIGAGLIGFSGCRPMNTVPDQTMTAPMSSMRLP